VNKTRDLCLLVIISITLIASFRRKQGSWSFIFTGTYFITFASSTTCVSGATHQIHTPQVQKITLPYTDYTHKNITSNFSQASSTFPEDGSQRIRNMSEFLSFKTLIERRF